MTQYIGQIYIIYSFCILFVSKKAYLIDTVLRIWDFDMELYVVWETMFISLINLHVKCSSRSYKTLSGTWFKTVWRQKQFRNCRALKTNNFTTFRLTCFQSSTISFVFILQFLNWRTLLSMVSLSACCPSLNFFTL